MAINEVQISSAFGKICSAGSKNPLRPVSLISYVNENEILWKPLAQSLEPPDVVSEIKVDHLNQTEYSTDLKLTQDTLCIAHIVFSSINRQKSITCCSRYCFYISLIRKRILSITIRIHKQLSVRVEWQVQLNIFSNRSKIAWNGLCFLFRQRWGPTVSFTTWISWSSTSCWRIKL